MYCVLGAVTLYWVLVAVTMYWVLGAVTLYWVLGAVTLYWVLGAVTMYWVLGAVTMYWVPVPHVIYYHLRTYFVPLIECTKKHGQHLLHTFPAQPVSYLLLRRSHI